MFKKIWQWLDGKKTIIACTYWTILVPALPQFYPNGIPSKINTTFIIIGLIMSVLGLGHKVVYNLTSDKSEPPSSSPST
jgi:hypothetical protein